MGRAKKCLVQAHSKDNGVHPTGLETRAQHENGDRHRGPPRFVLKRVPTDAPRSLTLSGDT